MAAPQHGEVSRSSGAIPVTQEPNWWDFESAKCNTPVHADARTASAGSVGIHVGATLHRRVNAFNSQVYFRFSPILQLESDKSCFLPSFFTFACTEIAFLITLIIKAASRCLQPWRLCDSTTVCVQSAVLFPHSVSPRCSSSLWTSPIKLAQQISTDDSLISSLVYVGSAVVLSGACS